MEFNEKLQTLRKQKGLTQEELAEALFVSRTAISKWESGRGYPSIDSLKAISKFFSVTIDALLSGEEVLTIAQEDSRQKQARFRDLVFGALDCSMALLCFLPFFGQPANDGIQAVSLLALTEISPYLRTVYYIAVAGTVLLGMATLALQNCSLPLWASNKSRLSLLASIAVVLVFLVSQQPYGAIFAFVFLIIKAFMLIKWQ